MKINRFINGAKRIGKETLGKAIDMRPPEVLAAEELEKRIRPGNRSIFLIDSIYDYSDRSRGLGYGYFQFYLTLLFGRDSLIYLPQDKIKKRFGVEKLSKIIREAVFYYNPDILVYHHYLDWVDYKVWEEISRELPTKTVVLLGDDLARYEEARPIWERFNAVVTMDKNAYEKRQREGFTNVFLSQWGVNHYLYRDLGLRRTRDVAFVGQSYGRRPEFIKRLRDRGIDVHVFGRGWSNSGRISQGDLVKIYNQSKIVFNNSISSKGTIALNARDFEAAACKSLVVTQDIEEVREYFVPGKEVVVYKDIDDAAEKIRYYLEHEKEREVIAQAGYERVLREHTYTKRFDDIFRFVENL